MAYRPLHCNLYDQIEIICMRRYELDIEMLDGRRFQARALNTRTSSEKEEFLQLGSDPDTGLQEVRLDLIRAVTVLDKESDLGRIELDTGICSF